MKKRLQLLISIFLGIAFLSGCSYFRSGKEGSEDFDNVPTQTAGFEDQDSFSYEGYGYANRSKAPYNQTYHFGFDRYDVKSEDIQSIHVQGNYLVTHPDARVRLEGNCDERGSREYNIALGWKRAKAVAEILRAQGVNNNQIATISYGKEKPIAFGHDEYSYVQNRRTDLVYESK